MVPYPEEAGYNEYMKKEWEEEEREKLIHLEFLRTGNPWARKEFERKEREQKQALSMRNGDKPVKPKLTKRKRQFHKQLKAAKEAQEHNAPLKEQWSFLQWKQNAYPKPFKKCYCKPNST